MEGLRNYDEMFPYLVLELADYFRLGTGSPTEKSVLRFCEIHSNEISGGVEFQYDPIVITRICDILCNKNKMTCIYKDNGMGYNNIYLFIGGEQWENHKMKMKLYFNSIVYGFSYIYKTFRTLVIPIVFYANDGTISVGTGFKLKGGIITARHCLEDAKNIAIKDFSAFELNSAEVFVHENRNIDLAFINVGKSYDDDIFIEPGEVMQEVITLGYPKVPAFTDFLTAEMATISSKATSRLTPSVGNIAAFGDNIFMNIELMLITAKIRGGNSGGPVINTSGSIVGVACQMPYYEGDYDDLGYGIVIPMKYVNDVIVRQRNKLIKDSEYFIDFE